MGYNPLILTFYQLPTGHPRVGDTTPEGKCEVKNGAGQIAR